MSVQSLAENEQAKPVRKAVGSKLRFEVFKRDRFKCQYCGRSAPDITLHLDHIQPIAKGGTNDIINLITSCIDCNLGKSDRPLDDHSTIEKQKAQLDALQERREQLEMMMDWQKELLAVNEEVTEAICSFWSQVVPGSNISESGKTAVRQWTARFSIDEICSAIKISAAQYLRFNDNGCTTESQQNAFNKIPGICSNRKTGQEDPDKAQMFYVRAILRNRGLYVNEGKYFSLFKKAKELEVLPIPWEDIRELAKTSKNWTDFFLGLQIAVFGAEVSDAL